MGGSMKVVLKTLILFVFLFGVFGCNEEPPRYAKFHKGQVVRFKAHKNIVGTIIYITAASNGACFWRDCRYDIRVGYEQEFTDSRVLSDDGPIKKFPLTVIEEVREYEIEVVEAEK